MSSAAADETPGTHVDGGFGFARAFSIHLLASCKVAFSSTPRTKTSPWGPRLREKPLRLPVFVKSRIETAVRRVKRSNWAGRQLGGVRSSDERHLCGVTEVPPEGQFHIPFALQELESVDWSLQRLQDLSASP